MLQIQKIKILTGQVRRIVNVCIIKKSNQCYSTEKEVNLQVPAELEFEGIWPKDVKEKLIKDMIVMNDFITPKEETSLVEELEPYLRRMRYEFDHWDNAIQGFRETERQKWFPNNKDILQKIVDFAFCETSKTLPHTHVLDLDEKGFIKPHVDSVRYCGTTISGISLLSDSVMKLVQTVEGNSITDDYRNQPDKESPDNKEDLYSVKIHLKRYSLYVMSNSARYNFTHEILKNEESIFKNNQIKKNRRISIICRNEP